MQHHENKEETIRILSGELSLIYGDKLCELKTLELIPGDNFHIAPKIIHRMIAKTDCEVLEVSTIQLDDIVRHEDLYGRN